MRKNLKTITYKGVTEKLSLVAWNHGVPQRTLLSRLHKGWSHDECVEGRKWRKNNRAPTLTLDYNGTRMTIHKWADLVGKSRHTLTSRYQRGWPVEEILYGRNCKHKLTID